MHIIPLDEILVQPRQRTSVPDKHIEELKASILEIGLLHPPVCWYNNEASKWELVAGECRLSAIKLLAREERAFTCGSDEVPPGFAPITGVLELLAPEDKRFEAELDENLRRKPLDWKDEARALAKLHDMRKRQNPEQTRIDTARELSSLSGLSPDYNVQKIREAEIVSAEIVRGNKAVIEARNQTEAISLIYRQQEDKIRGIIARRRMATLKGPVPISVHHGDLAIVLPSLEASIFDLILADPPYGIGADSAGYRARTVHHHNYEDSPAAAQALAEVIITEAFRVAKPRANLLMFFDIRHWDFLQKAAKRMGWAVFPRPLIWRKSESEGLAPWGSQGPRITSEFILYATKGQRGMTASPIDIFDFKRVPRTERLHAAEKPVELLKKLIEVCTLPGDHICDPCCGSGSSLIAAREAKRTALGIEKDEHYFQLAYANIHGGKDNGKDSASSDGKTEADKSIQGQSELPGI